MATLKPKPLKECRLWLILDQASLDFSGFQFCLRGKALPGGGRGGCLFPGLHRGIKGFGLQVSRVYRVP